MLQTVRIIIKGKVQAVFFRQSTKEKAIGLNITGHVKNLPDGTVEIIATANEEQLQELLQWCNHGPPRAVVTDIISTPVPLQPFNNFIIIR
ncbi:MAG: acylphosphatase [Chitinophagaceae bacterium]|nr:acylphosphatase [Chitinophagaceae bacterium]